MITCNLVSKKIITLSKTEKKNVLIPTNRLINTLKEKQPIMCLPKHIPMIVPPKFYSENQHFHCFVFKSVYSSRSCQESDEVTFLTVIAGYTPEAMRESERFLGYQRFLLSHHYLMNYCIRDSYLFLTSIIISCHIATTVYDISIVFTLLNSISLLL
jgi:hypothetical protein